MTDRDRAPMQIRVITALVIVGTFVSGAAMGAGVCFFSRRHPHPIPAPLMGRFLDRLGLSPAQEDKAHTIIDAHRAELEAIMRESFPRIRAVDERVEREIRALLNEQQRARLDRLKEEGGRPPFGGPHPGPGGPPWPPGPFEAPPPDVAPR